VLASPMSTDVVKYSYQPLDNESFRLLYLSPGSGTGVVACSLRNVSFKSGLKNSYETISYVWGNPQIRATVQLDGHCVSVPRSSHDVLRAVRSPERARCVWIDAICMNQDDLAERSQQVMIMAGIYMSSVGNLIFLSDDDGTAEAAL